MGDLARRAGVSVPTLSGMELGRTVTEFEASEIMHALCEIDRSRGIKIDVHNPQFPVEEESDPVQAPSDDLFIAAGRELYDTYVRVFAAYLRTDPKPAPKLRRDPDEALACPKCGADVIWSCHESEPGGRGPAHCSAGPLASRRIDVPTTCNWQGEVERLTDHSVRLVTGP